jgi:hypothetical protein
MVNPYIPALLHICRVPNRMGSLRGGARGQRKKKGNEQNKAQLPVFSKEHRRCNNFIFISLGFSYFALLI